MSDNLRDRIAAVLREHFDEAAPSLSMQDMADAVTDLLIDMAGKGELLKAIDGMYR